MKNFLNEWRMFVENNQELFQKNIEKLISFAQRLGAAGYSIENVKTLTPENAKILTEVELDQMIGQGGYGRVFSLKGSDFVIKFFSGGVDFSSDIDRIEKSIKRIFSGTEEMGKMHYLDYGKLGKSMMYVIMPRLVPFTRSNVFKLNSLLFRYVGSALGDLTTKLNSRSISYTDFRELFYESLANTIKDYFNTQKKIDDFIGELNEFDETIHKILRAAYKAFKEEAGIDLHIGNLGFFEQKPDDWFFFDM